MILSWTWRRAGAVALVAVVGACGAPVEGTSVDATAVSTTSSAPVRPTSTTARPRIAPDCSVDRGAQEPMGAADRIGPLLQVGDRTYLGRGPVLPATAALETIGRVCRRDEGGRLEDGDGPYEPGTELRRVFGYDPRFRLGVIAGDRLDVWELYYDPAARVGADLLDLSIGVDAIEVRSADLPEVTVTAWQDDGRIEAITGAFPDAPLDPSVSGAWAYRLVFRLRDGTTVERVFDPDRGSLQGLLLGPTVVGLFADVPRPEPLPPPTTAATMPPPVTRPPGPVELAVVRELADALDIAGELEVMPGEQGDGACINRLGSPMLCVDVPLWGLWQYADGDAQSRPSATPDEAIAAATALLQRLGLPVELGELGSNGAQVTIAFRAGGSMVVAEGGRISQIIAPTAMLPA
jgi:hypothetical protein